MMAIVVIIMLLSFILMVGTAGDSLNIVFVMSFIAFVISSIKFLFLTKSK
jgi:hypothetical protein